MSEEWFVFQTYALANQTSVLAEDTSVQVEQQSQEIQSLQSQVDGFLSPVGAVTLYAGQANNLPAGWLLCDGSLYSSTSYAELFSVIGITYGSAPDQFAVPDLRNKFSLGANTSNIGTTGGSSSITLTTDQLPSHSHTLTNGVASVSSVDAGHTHSVTAVNGRSFNGIAGSNQWIPNQESPTTTSTSYASITSTITGSTDGTGSGAVVDVTPPYLALNYIICYTKSL
jgi:microcystin-dependent protein